MLSIETLIFSLYTFDYDSNRMDWDMQIDRVLDRIDVRPMDSTLDRQRSVHVDISNRLMMISLVEILVQKEMPRRHSFPSLSLG